MDVEAEIRNLKQRMSDLEVHRPYDEQDDDQGAVVVTGEIAPAKGAVTDFQREVVADLEALNLEVAGLRWQTRNDFACGHSELMKRLDDLRIDIHYLDFKLDQLLKKDAVI